MKKIDFLSLLLCACMAWGFYSCSDSDEETSWPGGVSAKLLPTRIYGEKTERQYLFEYDTGNRLVKFTIRYGKDAFVTNEISYDDQGRVESRYEYYQSPTFPSLTLPTEVKYTYVYDGNTVGVMYRENQLKKIEIDAEGRILNSRESNSNNSEEFEWKIDFNYDTNGNVTEKEISRKNLNNNIYSYSYDNNNGIFKHIGTPQWFLLSELGEFYSLYLCNYANNYVSTDAYYVYNDVKEPMIGMIETMTYEYNENGYPVRYSNPEPLPTCGTPPVPDRETNFIVKYQLAR